MSDNTKKGLLIAVVVLAIVAAIFGAKSTFTTEKPEVVGHISMPPGFKSEREQDLERLKAGQGGGTSAPAPAGEKDLGGDLK